MFRFVYALAVLGFISINSALASEDQLKEIYKNYVTGNFQAALKDLETFKTNDKKLQGTRLYWQALCNSRLQKFPEAIRLFEETKKSGFDTQDLDYEYGQALYAMNQLDKARAAFEKSANKNFKRPTSYYYVGHIAQIQEEFTAAKLAYEKILKEKESETSLVQFARFQIAEVVLAIAEQKEEKKENKEEMSVIVQKYILPQFEKALAINPDSQNATDIKRRMDEVKKQHGLDPNFLSNGRQLTPKKLELSASQKISYDNNITQATDLPTTRTTQKESYIFDTEAFAKYRFVAKRRFVTSPEVRLTRTKYGDQETAEVYTNDSYTVAPALRFKDEHKLFGEMASAIFDLEYNYTLRDRLSQHKNVYYGSAWAEAIGEKFKLFSAGETTIKFKFKQYTAYDSNLDSTSFTPSLSQIIFLSKIRHLLLILIQSDMTTVTDENQSADNHLLRFDYIVPEFYNNFWSLQASFALTLTDPKVGKETRGLEKTYNPGLKITRNISQEFQVSLSYDYTKKTSGDETAYAYTKNVTAFELRYSF